MENKNVGLLIIGIATVMVIVVIIFNNAMRDIASQSCTMGPLCTMYDTIKVQTGISLSIIALVFIIGMVIMFSKPKGKIVIKTLKEKRKKLDLSGLDSKEKEVVRLIQEENGIVFQATLMEKLGIGKVGITRLLDKLEAKQIIERKRRGMNNVVVLRG